MHEGVGVRPLPMDRIDVQEVIALVERERGVHHVENVWQKPRQVRLAGLEIIEYPLDRVALGLNGSLGRSRTLVIAQYHFGAFRQPVDLPAIMAQAG